MTEAAFISGDDALAQAHSLPPHSLLLLLGGMDTGKTTWTLQAARALAQAGKSVAVVDCDLGQSEVGPPGTVGAALVRPDAPGELRALRDLAPCALAFVGALSPARVALEWAAAASRVLREARTHQPDIVLVDTCGWVQGHAAVAAKSALADLLAPDVVLVFGHGDELTPLLRAFSHAARPTLRRVAPQDAAARKTPAARATRRMARFAKALADAREMTLNWDDIALRGTSLGLGDPVPFHVRRFVSETLRAPVLHAETSSSAGLFVVVHGDGWDRGGLVVLERHFRVSHIQVTSAQKYAGLYLGLIGSDGRLLDIGVLSRLDFEARTLTLQTPCRRPAAVCQVRLGLLRLHPDGRARGEIAPGEV